MKNFEEIYKKIYSENFDELEKVRKQKLLKKFIIAIIIIIIATVIAIFSSSPFIAICLATIAIIIVSVIPDKFNSLYKSRIITELIKGYDPNLSFDSQLSIPRSLYNQAEFESYDRYYSNDYIYGKIDGIIPFELGDIHTEDESTDSDGHTTSYTVFRGLFSAAEFNQSINTTIKIRSDKGFLGKLVSNKEIMQMDSQEFEKLFDVYSKDKITVMRILTSDILDYMVTFKKENKVKFELTLKNKQLFIRIHCKNMFESNSILKKSIDEKSLQTYYKYLDFMCELNRKFCNVIAEKNI